MVGTFSSHCNPKTNETYERYVFHRRNQLPGGSIEQFVTDLNIKAQTCQFDNLRDSTIHDRLVLGITNQRVRGRLLREDDLTLDKTIQIRQVAEASERQIQSLAATVDRDAHVNYCNARWRHQQKKTSQNPMKPKSSAKQCGSCDTVHTSRACLACGKACNKCGKMGHFVRVCRSKPKKGKDHYVSHNEATSNANEMFVGLKIRGDDETKPIWNHKETTRWELFDQVQIIHRL